MTQCTRSSVPVIKQQKLVESPKADKFLLSFFNKQKTELSLNSSKKKIQIEIKNKQSWATATCIKCLSPWTEVTFLPRIAKVLEITRDTASLYIVCLCGTPHHNYGWRERQIEEKDICCGSFEAAGNARQMDGDALFCSFLHHLNPIFLQFRVILMPFCS